MFQSFFWKLSDIVLRIILLYFEMINVILCFFIVHFSYKLCYKSISPMATYCVFTNNYYLYITSNILYIYLQ